LRGSYLEPRSMSTVLRRQQRMNGKTTLISLCLSRDGWKNEGYCRYPMAYVVYIEMRHYSNLYIEINH
jgi:hypothetical protein